MSDTTLNVIEASTGSTPLGAIQVTQGSDLVKISKTTIVNQAGNEVNFGTVEITNDVGNAIPVSGTVEITNDAGNAIPVSGTVEITNDVGNPIPVLEPVSTLIVSSTGAAGAAVTLTLPAVAGNFHYIGSIEIVAYTTAARTGGATPVTVTSTNLPGNPTWLFSSAGAVGAIERFLLSLNNKVKSSTVNTSTTIVCPATTNVIWNVKVIYHTAT